MLIDHSAVKQDHRESSHSQGESARESRKEEYRKAFSVVKSQYGGNLAAFFRHVDSKETTEAFNSFSVTK